MEPLQIGKRREVGKLRHGERGICVERMHRKAKLSFVSSGSHSPMHILHINATSFPSFLALGAESRSDAALPCLLRFTATKYRSLHPQC